MIIIITYNVCNILYTVESHPTIVTSCVTVHRYSASSYTGRSFGTQLWRIALTTTAEIEDIREDQWWQFQVGLPSLYPHLHQPLLPTPPPAIHLPPFHMQGDIFNEHFILNYCFSDYFVKLSKLEGHLRPDKALWEPDRVMWEPNRALSGHNSAIWEPDRAFWESDRVLWEPDRACTDSSESLTGPSVSLVWYGLLKAW